MENQNNESTNPNARHAYIPRGTVEFAQACREALATQTVRYAVAPGQRIGIGGHLDFYAYDEIKVSDLEGHSVDPQARMRELIALGLVVEQQPVGA